MKVWWNKYTPWFPAFVYVKCLRSCTWPDSEAYVFYVFKLCIEIRGKTVN